VAAPSSSPVSWSLDRKIPASSSQRESKDASDLASQLSISATQSGRLSWRASHAQVQVGAVQQRVGAHVGDAEGGEPVELLGSYPAARKRYSSVRYLSYSD